MGMWANSAIPGYLLTVELPASRAVNRAKLRRWARAVKKTGPTRSELGPHLSVDSDSDSDSDELAVIGQLSTRCRTRSRNRVVQPVATQDDGVLLGY